MSLANVLAMARSARSIVLLGDPQQLDQPLQGSHPPGADRSALAHLLDGHDAIPETLGLFLEHTWRLHPSVTAFTSTAFYEGKLASRPNLEGQRLLGPEPMRGAGVRMLEADHVGADSYSPRRRTRSRGSSGPWSRAARRGSTRTAWSTRSRTGTSSWSLRTTPRSGRSQRSSRPRRASARSTSSRARRRRSASIR